MTMSMKMYYSNVDAADMLQSFMANSKFRKSNPNFNPFYEAMRKVYEVAGANKTSALQALEDENVQTYVQEIVEACVGGLRLIGIIPQLESNFGADTPFGIVMSRVQEALFEEIKETIRIIIPKFNSYQEMVSHWRDDSEISATFSRSMELKSLANDIIENLRSGTFGRGDLEDQSLHGSIHNRSINEPIRGGYRNAASSGCLIPIAVVMLLWWLLS